MVRGYPDHGIVAEMTGLGRIFDLDLGGESRIEDAIGHIILGL